ncbi:MAG: amidohydrolase family protein [Clostridia bacterium]|nr:amidohydrolase family protein [Clostridia bacterium]
MRIDAHNHADWHKTDLQCFLKNMDEFNIDVTWLLSWECPRHEYENYNGGLATYLTKGPIPFEAALEYKKAYPEKFVLGYCPDPRNPDAINNLKAATYIHKVQVCGELKVRMMYDDFDAIRFYRTAGELNLPVIMHFDYEFNKPWSNAWPNFWYGGGIDVLERILKKCPETTFLGHAPGFWAHISNDDQFDKLSYPKGPVIKDGMITQLLDKYDNLYCDMSAGSGWNAFNRDLEHAYWFMNNYQDRILYARDYFDNRHQELIESLDLKQEVKDKIYFKNALKLVPLK